MRRGTLLSQNEMKKPKAQNIILALLMTMAPSFSWAAIPFFYFPAYSYHSATPQDSRTPASINRAAIMVSTPSKIFYGEDGTSISPELIANFNHIKTADKPLDASSIIPIDMVASNDQSLVFAQVADRSLNSFLNSQAVRESTVGQAATTVEQKMKQEVIFGGENTASVQHKLNFSVQAFQTLAQIQYSGYTNAAIKYKIASAQVDVELFEKFSGNRDLVFNHTITKENRMSGMSMRWNF
jgi:hypothetical protein